MSQFFAGFLMAMLTRKAYFIDGNKLKIRPLQRYFHTFI